MNLIVVSQLNSRTIMGIKKTIDRKPYNKSKIVPNSTWVSSKVNSYRLQ